MNTTAYKLSAEARRHLWRRIIYSYALTLFLRPAFAYGLVFGGSIQLFRELVFVRMVILNFLTVEVGQVPAYFFSLLFGTDTIKVALLAVMATSLILLFFSLRRTARSIPSVSLLSNVRHYS